MKNRSRFTLILALILVLVTVFALSSCTLDDIATILGEGGNQSAGGGNTTPGDGGSGSDGDSLDGGTESISGGGNGSSGVDLNEYMTREEVLKLLEGISQNVNVTNQDIDITSSYSSELLAASKGLLSAVSINAIFNVEQQYYTIVHGLPQLQTQVKPATQSGAGVIYRLDKNTGSAYIITNYHVVYNVSSNDSDHISDNISLFLYGKEYSNYAIPASYVGGSMEYDIAVLKVSSNPLMQLDAVRAADFADSSEVSVLETVIAIGNPAGLGISATVGCVNVDSEDITMTAVDGVSEVTMRVMRIDAAVNSGNSGGGLFNDEGEVIGIVNAKISSSNIDNIGYAIPSNVASAIADNIIYYDDKSSDNDAAYKFTVGIKYGITEAGAIYDTDAGKVHIYDILSVNEVVSGSVAEAAGLAAGDCIKAVSIDGVRYEIDRFHTLEELELLIRADSEVVYHITRGNQDMNLTLDFSLSTLTKIK